MRNATLKKRLMKNLSDTARRLEGAGPFDSTSDALKSVAVVLEDVGKRAMLVKELRSVERQVTAATRRVKLVAARLERLTVE